MLHVVTEPRMTSWAEGDPGAEAGPPAVWFVLGEAYVDLPADHPLVHKYLSQRDVYAVYQVEQAPREYRAVVDSLNAARQARRH